MDFMGENSSAISRLPCGVLGQIFGYLDPLDRNAVSEVCVQWKELDSSTRTSVSVANFSLAPRTLFKRFPKLDTLAIEGRAPQVWGWESTLEPWVHGIAKTYEEQLKCLLVSGMIVTDSDLILLSRFCSKSLTELRLRKCSGFSTAGLASITKQCSLLEVLDLESSRAVAYLQGRFFRDEPTEMFFRNLAEHSKLQELNISPCSVVANSEDVHLILKNCGALRSLKLSVFFRFKDVSEILNRSTSLLELGPGTVQDVSPTDAWKVSFPSSVTSLCRLDLDNECLPIKSSILGNLKNLDIFNARLNQASYAEILGSCSNLETLKVVNDVGDDGLLVVAKTCVHLREIKIPYLFSGDPERPIITPRGIIPLVQMCGKLQRLQISVSELNNATLTTIGNQCPALTDCRFRHASVELEATSLDEGVKHLLRGCRFLTVFSFELGFGTLTDKGLTYIGKYGESLKSIKLSYVGEASATQLDLALLDIATGCKYLTKLTLQKCSVSEKGLADAVRHSKSLKYVHADGKFATNREGRLLAQSRQHWVVEYQRYEPAILAYSTIAEPRVTSIPMLTILTASGGVIS